MTIKTLKISDNTHQKLKLFCVKNKLKLNELVESIIINYIKNEKSNN